MLGIPTWLLLDFYRRSNLFPMASPWTEEETFTCSVCLETLRDPATLPCGHSYCLVCIQDHWDKKDSQGQYSCPQCRQVFNPRPSLAKSTLLVEAMEKLRTNSLRQKEPSNAPPSLPIYMDVLPGDGPQPGCIYPQLPLTVAPRMCPEHNQPLDLFCHEDRECVCALCRQYGHRGHRVVRPGEERTQRQDEVVQMQLEVQRHVQQTERALKEIPYMAKHLKVLVQALQIENTDLFSDLIKVVNVTGTQVGEALGTHETSLGSWLEGKVQRMEQEVVRLHWRSEELQRLADMQDHICFLKNFFLVEPLGHTDAELGLGHQEAVVSSVRSALKELQVSIEDQCKAAVTKIQAIVNNEAPTSETNYEPATVHNGTQNRVYETVLPGPVAPTVPQVEASAPPPPLPLRLPVVTVAAVGPVSLEPKTRDEMLKYRFVPTMDLNTAYRHVQLLDGGRKATLKAENMNYREHPERFQFWRQVLCREALGGSPYYWEVEWTGTKVTIGVAYKEMDRGSADDRSRLGHNPESWSLYWSGNGFSFWHSNQEKLLGSPKAKRVGVYLDQHAGVLAFYRVTKNQADLIHRHQVDFTGPLYPGFRFWAGVGATITICDLD
ncbi:LOW QUALITY PROTEIN: finTRIM family, member 86 [Periophthalmus magnuspinnatus]|uniref:LOW QUALITY PROTEIN: finTRIM family, member 86 n=1 Tax=Periophthalmus magnuspinnatus TaxID=409849 RepID=UPI002436E5C0|nr:LOW QUALITY PROTEIN: finTRIM family, member 86 [Periophthalmus magnuspinnatus]